MCSGRVVTAPPPQATQPPYKDYKKKKKTSPYFTDKKVEIEEVSPWDHKVGEPGPEVFEYKTGAFSTPVHGIPTAIPINPRIGGVAQCSPPLSQGPDKLKVPVLNPQPLPPRKLRRNLPPHPTNIPFG